MFIDQKRKEDERNGPGACTSRTTCIISGITGGLKLHPAPRMRLWRRTNTIPKPLVDGHCSALRFQTTRFYNFHHYRASRTVRRMPTSRNRISSLRTTPRDLRNLQTTIMDIVSVVIKLPSTVKRVSSSTGIND